jgi:hypothetical protein
MKSIVIAVVAGIILFGSPTSALADEASKNAKIEEMLQLTHVDRMISQSFDQMKTMVSSQMSKADMSAEDRQHAEELQQKMMAMIADRLSWEKSKASYVRIYAETYTESEVDGILAFYKSPAGQAMLEKMPQLMQKSMELSQRLMGDVMPQIQQMAEQLKQK